MRAARADAASAGRGRERRGERRGVGRRLPRGRPLRNARAPSGFRRAPLRPPARPGPGAERAQRPRPSDGRPAPRRRSRCVRAWRHGRVRRVGARRRGPSRRSRGLHRRPRGGRDQGLRRRRGSGRAGSADRRPVLPDRLGAGRAVVSRQHLSTASRRARGRRSAQAERRLSTSSRRRSRRRRHRPRRVRAAGRDLPAAPVAPHAGLAGRCSARIRTRKPAAAVSRRGRLRLDAAPCAGAVASPRLWRAGPRRRGRALRRRRRRRTERRSSPRHVDVGRRRPALPSPGRDRRDRRPDPPRRVGGRPDRPCVSQRGGRISAAPVRLRRSARSAPRFWRGRRVGDLRPRPVATQARGAALHEGAGPRSAGDRRGHGCAAGSSPVLVSALNPQRLETPDPCRGRARVESAALAHPPRRPRRVAGARLPSGGIRGGGRDLDLGDDPLLRWS